MIANELAEMHSLNVLHRDIKPINIILLADKHDETVQKVRLSQRNHRLVKRGAMYYMAPEIKFK